MQPLAGRHPSAAERLPAVPCLAHTRSYACSISPAARQAPALIYLPTTASATKMEQLVARGACVVQHGTDCVEAEAEARRVAEERGQVYISPYNDSDVSVRSSEGRICGWVCEGELAQVLNDKMARRVRTLCLACCPRPAPSPPMQVIAGQGTVAVELLSQLPEGVDVCFIPVGGGGLIAGARVGRACTRFLGACIKVHWFAALAFTWPAWLGGQGWPGRRSRLLGPTFTHQPGGLAGHSPPYATHGASDPQTLLQCSWHAGMAAVLKTARPGCRVVGCQPAASDVMRQSVAAGIIVDVPSQPTLSDATAGGPYELFDCIV